MSKLRLAAMATLSALLLHGEALAADPKSVTFVPGVMGNAFYVSMECGIRAAAAKAGLRVNVQGPQQFDASLQIPIVNGVVAQKPGALLIAPCDSKALFVPIKQANDAGIPVILVDTTLANKTPTVSAISTDNVQGGAAAADALATLIGKKGKVLVVAFKAGASTSDDRQHGFEAQIKKYPDITYVGVQYSDNDPSKAAAVVASTMAAHPDLAGIFATNDRSAEGTATSLRNLGKIGVVKVVGFDAGDVQVKQLQEGIVQALIAQKPYEIGVRAVEAAAAKLSGKTPPRDETTGTVTVTKENLSQPEVQAVLYKLSCK